MVTLKRLSLALSLTLALAAATALSAQNQAYAQAPDQHEEHDRGGGGHPAAPHGRPPGPPAGLHGPGRPGGMAARGPRHDFRGHDFSHFSPAERAMWSGGRWHHEFHDGRLGWWWDVGGLWYFYPEPIYPYPGYVADFSWEPPVAEVPAYAPGYWYFCSASGAYYPYVQTCAVPWTPVAPAPPAQ